MTLSMLISATGNINHSSWRPVALCLDSLIFWDIFAQRSIDHIPSIHDHRRALHETGFATAEKQHTICHFLRCSFAIHWGDGDRWADYVFRVWVFRTGHWRVCEEHSRLVYGK